MNRIEVLFILIILRILCVFLYALISVYHFSAKKYFSFEFREVEISSSVEHAITSTSVNLNYSCFRWQLTCIFVVQYLRSVIPN